MNLRAVLILIIISSALGYINAGDMYILMEGGNNITVKYLSPDAELVSFKQKICMIPKEEIISQELENLSIDGCLLFEKGEFKNSGWKFKYEIHTKKNITKLSLIPFSPEELEDYLKFNSLIQNTTEIYSLATNLTKGKDVISSLASIFKWIRKNVKYSFVEMYANQTLPASKVLEYKEGVCDEFSTLFISLARSVGIPTRYVSGFAYGNIPGYEGFGTHSWVEAYIPSYGWMPIDPSFGEFGWLDPTHIAISKEIDPTYIYTEIKGYDIDNIEYENHLSSLLLNTFSDSGIKILKYTNETKFLDADISTNKKIFANGDFVLLNISIDNPTKYYIPTSIRVISTENIKPEINWIPLIIWPGNHYYYVILNISGVNERTMHPIEVYIPNYGTIETSIIVDPLLAPSTNIEELKILESNTRLDDISIIIDSDKTIYNKEISAVIKISSDKPLNATLKIYCNLSNQFFEKEVILNNKTKITVKFSDISEGNGEINAILIKDNYYINNKTYFVSTHKPEINIIYIGNKTFYNDYVGFKLRIINKYNDSIYGDLLLKTPHYNTSKSIMLEGNYKDINVNLPSIYFDKGENIIKVNLTYTRVDDEEKQVYYHYKEFKINREVKSIISLIIEWFLRLIGVI